MTKFFYVLLATFCVTTAACSSSSSNHSNPATAAKFANLSTISSIEVGSNPYAFVIAGPKILYTDELEGLGAVDASNPGSLLLSKSLIPSSFLDGFDTMYDMALAGNVAVIAVNPACLGYCMGDRRELRLYDISSTSRPQYLSSLNISADHILADENTLYISSSGSTHNNFYVVDITAPSAPVVVSTTNVSDAGYLAKKDNIVILSRILLNGSPDKYKDIESIDVSDRAHPTTQNGSPLVSLNQAYSPMTILGDALYYLDDAGLNVVDMSDRANPAFVRTVSLQGARGQSFASYNNKLYVAAGSLGVMIFDVSQPKNPTYLKSMKSATAALMVTISNGIGAYLTNWETVPAPAGINSVSGYKLNLFYDK